MALGGTASQRTTIGLPANALTSVAAAAGSAACCSVASTSLAAAGRCVAEARQTGPLDVSAAALSAVPLICKQPEIANRGMTRASFSRDMGGVQPFPFAWATTVRPPARTRSVPLPQFSWGEGRAGPGVRGIFFPGTRGSQRLLYPRYAFSSAARSSFTIFSIASEPASTARDPCRPSSPRAPRARSASAARSDRSASRTPGLSAVLE